MPADALMAADDALLPCPFCGGPGECRDVGESAEIWMVGCSNPECPIGCDICDRDREDAIRQWNTRATPTLASSALVDAGSALAEREAPLSVDFANAFPGGQLDTSSFEAIEEALDRADAPSMNGDRWLTLPERIAAISSWRPISDAPRDGSEINAFREDQGVFTCRWAEMEEFVAKNAAGDPIEDYDDTVAGWWHDRWGWLEGDCAPTLWRPLPAPPGASPSRVTAPGREEVARVIDPEAFIPLDRASIKVGTWREGSPIGRKFDPILAKADRLIALFERGR